MITYQQIQYILALAEERHFIKASERCFVTQPTLSMQVKKAEELLGHSIFDRSANPLELTRFGEDLIPVLRDIQNGFDRIGSLKSKAEGRYVERLRLAVIPTISGYLLPDLFQRLNKELPNVELVITELKTEEVLEALDEKRVDVGIIAGPHYSDRLRSIPLFKEEIMAYYPEGKENAVSVKDLEQVDPWLLTAGNCLRNQMMNFCKINTSESGWNYEGGNIELLLRMVDLHGGYTLVPGYYKHILDKPFKHIYSEHGEIPIRDNIAIFPHRSIKWPSIERLIRIIQQSYNESIEVRKVQVLNWR